jgi:hypothetical protein
VYGPCSPSGRADFTNWLYNSDASVYELWFLLGDFNLIRHPENKRRPGGNMNDMMIFNDIISHLDLIEIPLKIKAFTWSNMQQNVLLEKLDWVFTSSSWTNTFPNTMAFALSHVISDHVPYVTQMESSVSKSSVFRFENYWVSFPDFLPIVEYYWQLPCYRDNKALIMSGKLKTAQKRPQGVEQGSFKTQQTDQ